MHLHETLLSPSWSMPGFSRDPDASRINLIAVATIFPYASSTTAFEMAPWSIAAITAQLLQSSTTRSLTSNRRTTGDGTAPSDGRRP